MWETLYNPNFNPLEFEGVRNQAGLITSIEIAELTGKMHKHVMEAIRKMEPAWESERGTNFRLSQIREKISNNGYKLRPCYLLTKTESLFIATKFNDVARARLVIRWENLETAQLSLQTPRQETKLLVTEREILRKGDEIRRVEIERENAPADGCFTMSEIAKDLDTTVKELNKLLVKEGVQYYNGGRYKLNEDYQNSGLAQERSFHYYTLDGEKKERLYLVWTHEGAEFVKEIFCRQ